MKKILKGDEVQILLGKDRGKTGHVERVLTDQNKIMVNGVNVYKRSLRANALKSLGNSSDDIKGQIIDIVKSINLSNVALICPNCQKATRVGLKMEGKEKVRFCKKCQKVIGGKNV